MTSSETRPENASNSFVHSPRASLRIASALVWSVAAFLLYKALDPSAPPWALWGTSAIFALTCYSVLNEFMLRPTRVTTIRPEEREILIQETARWHNKEFVVPITPGARFEVAFCDRDSDLYEVRIKAAGRNPVVVAEYVSKQEAERIARDANSRLAGF